MSAAVIADPICELAGPLADGAFNPEIHDTLNRSVMGQRIDLPWYARFIGTSFLIWRVLEVGFDGCEIRMRFDVTLDRLWPRRNAHGTFDVKGTVYAAKRNVVFENRPDIPPVVQTLACLRDMETERFNLSDTTNLTEELIEIFADKQNGQCYPVGTLWPTVEQSIAGIQFFDPAFPSLEYEWLTDLTVPCNGQCPSLKDPNGHTEFFDYGIFSTQVGTALHETGGDFEFELADNDDLFAIKKFNTGSGMTEVHVLSAATNYQAFSLQTATGLHETGNNVEFALLPNRDLVVLIKSSTGSGTTEVHVLSAASNYQEFTMHTATALHETGDNVELEVAENGDLFALIKSGTGTGTTEVHVLSAASGYQEFTMHTGTALHETGDSFEFVLMDDGDIAAIAKNNTGSGRTEVHMLDADTGYQSFKLQVPTALAFADHRFDFLAADNRDIVAIVKEGGSTGMTQVHRLVR